MIVAGISIRHPCRERRVAAASLPDPTWLEASEKAKGECDPEDELQGERTGRIRVPGRSRFESVRVKGGDAVIGRASIGGRLWGDGLATFARKLLADDVFSGEFHVFCLFEFCLREGHGKYSQTGKKCH